MRPTSIRMILPTETRRLIKSSTIICRLKAMLSNQLALQGNDTPVSLTSDGGAQLHLKSQPASVKNTTLRTSLRLHSSPIKKTNKAAFAG